ncbi:MAG: polyphenol oxidase family protein [Patescibacteria group bacterium]|jgi:YfiH family protein
MRIFRLSSLRKPGLFHATFPKECGWASFENSTLTLSRRLEKTMVMVSGISSDNFVSCEQVHGETISVLKNHESLPPKNVFYNSDGIVTDKKGVLIIVRHADCVPIFLYDPHNLVVGLIHSGWRGTAQSIGVKALKRMMVEFGTNPKDVFVGLGPSAHNCCYTIESGWPHEVLISLPQWRKFLRRNTKGWQVDLVGYIKQEFIEFGVRQKSIETAGICTICDLNYYSWTRQRQHKETKGMGVSVIALL